MFTQVVIRTADLGNRRLHLAPLPLLFLQHRGQGGPRLARAGQADSIRDGLGCPVLDNLEVKKMVSMIKRHQCLAQLNI